MNQMIKIILVAAIGMFVIGCGEKTDAPATSDANAPAAAPAALTEAEALALFNQALDLRDGKNGVTQDLPKAFELFSKASEAGNRDAMFFLAVMYESGESVDVDYDKALMWYTKSDELGCGSAAPKLKALKAKMAKK